MQTSPPLRSQPESDVPASWLSRGITTSHLELVFSLARIPWVCDFLFRPDTSGDLDTISGPLQLTNGWGADVRVHVRDTNGTFAGALDMDFAFRLALIPAVSCGTLTVGTAIQESPQHTPHISVGRFVRDDANGAVFFIAHRAETACTEVLFIYHASAMRTSRYFMRFHADAFRDILPPTGESLRVSALSRCLIYCTLQSEVRDCPMCRSPTSLLCNCTLAFIPPKHSVDFAPLRANMQAVMGRFEGTGVGELYVNGESIVAHSTSKVHVMPSSDGNLLQRLAMLGTQQLMLSDRPKPSLPGIDFNEQSNGVSKDFNYVQSLESIIHESLGHPQTPPPPSCSSLQLPGLHASANPMHFSPVSELGARSESENRIWNDKLHSMALMHSPTSSQGSSGHERTRGPRRGPRKPISEEVLRERERRKQIRIFKNRAAAARSNARRKMQNDALKGALAEVRGQALQLRDKHMALREENLRLKMALLM